MKKMVQFFKGKRLYRYSFIVAAILVSAAVVYAGSVPYTFSSGTVAKSSEVNANFQAVVNGMAAAKTSGNGGSATFTSKYPAGTNLLTLSATIPSPGKVIVTASGSVCINNHTLGSTDAVYLKISKTSAALSGDGPFQIYRVDKTEPTYIDLYSCVPFHISDVFDETSAGTLTYYLNGSIDYSLIFTGQIQQVSFYALYVPNSLP